MHAHMASGTSGSTDTTETTESECAIESAVPRESTHKWEWSEGTWVLNAHAAVVSKGGTHTRTRTHTHAHTHTRAWAWQILAGGGGFE